MKAYLPVLKILGRFLLIYLLLLVGYQLYLTAFKDSAVDPFTAFVGDQCALLQNGIGFNTQMVPDIRVHGSYFYVNNIWATLLVEGCNAISVMILFVAFIFAFYKGLKRTFLFVFGGLVVLYILNVLRIVLLNIIAVEHSSYLKPAHDYLFPAIIYGGVVVLWLVWVKVFVLKDEEQA